MFGSQQRARPWQVMLWVAIVIVTAGGNTAAVAQGGPSIFSPSTPSAASERRPANANAAAEAANADGSTLRSRRVVPDLSALKMLAVPIASGAASMPSNAAGMRSQASLHLDLFPDAALDVDIERRDTLAPDRIAIVGRIAGDPRSAAYFVVDGDALAADIVTQSAHYDVRATRDGGHVLRQVDPNPAFTCGIAPSSPANVSVPPARPAPQASAAVSAGDGTAAASLPVTVDLMVLYTAAAEAAAGGVAGIRSEIALAVVATNDALQRSGVVHRYRLVHTALTPYDESGSLHTDFDRLNSQGDGDMDEAFALVEHVRADVVTLVVETSTDVSGTAAVMYTLGRNTSGVHLWNVVRRVALLRTLPHELGHNAGLKHDRDNAGTGTPLFPYAYGYRIPGKFATIMSYTNCTTAPCPRIPYYSNPTVTYSATPTGVADVADEARVLGQTMPILASEQGGCVLNGGTPLTVPAGGGTVTYQIAATAGCAWSVMPLDASMAWLTLTAPANGTGPGPITFMATANASTAASSGAFTLRTGSVTTAVEVVRQAAAPPPPPPPCTVQTSTTRLSVPADGGPASIGVTASSASCAWSATTDSPFVTIAGGSGSGSGSVPFTVQPNALAVARTATIAVGGTLVVVEQAASPVPARTWTRYLAEGATGTFFSTRIALLNPNAEAAGATLRFQRADGVGLTRTMTIPAWGRTTVSPESVSGLEAHDFSTVVESSVPLVIDRSMTWSAIGRYGSHAETAVSAPSKTWYLAEGSTSGDFSLFYLLQNPNPSPVQARLTYLRSLGAPPVQRAYMLPPSSRTTIAVDAEGPELASTDVSAVITADAPIIVERSMYLSRPGQPFAAGHESAGVTEPATRWFLAEGATGPFFDLFILLANPDARAASVSIDYLLLDGRTFTKRYTVPANSRFTIAVDDEDMPGVPGRPLANVAVSSTITSTNGVPILVERTMWWPSPALGPHYWTEAHNSPGARETGMRWAMAEGEVGGTDAAETFILIANTSAHAGQARVTILYEHGEAAERTYTLPPLSRTNVPVGLDFPQSNARRFGAIVQSLADGPSRSAPQLVVERAIYTSAGGVVWGAGTNALATRLQ